MQESENIRNHLSKKVQENGKSVKRERQGLNRVPRLDRDQERTFQGSLGKYNGARLAAHGHFAAIHLLSMACKANSHRADFSVYVVCGS